MGFYTIKLEEDWKPSWRRVAIQGPPNTWKTSSAKTFADASPPLALLSYPGEMGVNSVPRHEGILPYIWRDTAEDKLDSLGKFRAVEEFTAEVISGKYGKIGCFFGDGLHNLATLALDAASDGTFLKGKDFNIERAFGIVDPYTKSYNMMVKYINMVNESPVPLVVFTMWDGRESEGKDKNNRDVSRVYPELPGKLAKKVMGMFPLVLYSKIVPMQPPKYLKPRGVWQIKADDQIAGAAVKVPIDIQNKLPQQVEQDWAALEALLQGK